jgi:hypothetical protein
MIGTFRLALEWKRMVGIFCDHLEYSTVIWCILWPFGKWIASWYVYSVLVCEAKSGNPASQFFLVTNGTT